MTEVYFYKERERTNYVDRNVNVTVQENRAPTDDSIKIYDEMREKAMKDVLKVVQFDNIAKGSVALMRSAELLGYCVYVQAKINGHEYSKKLRFDRFDIERSEATMIEIALDVVAEWLAKEILYPAYGDFLTFDK